MFAGVLRLTLVAIVLAAPAAAREASAADQTYGCEANPTSNPIGGGEGYSDVFRAGDFRVTRRDELVTALKKARPGQVVFVPHGVEIDLSDERTLSLPAGVTLAGTRLARWPGHASDVLDLAITPDGRRLVSASADTTLLVWDLPIGGS